jgi:hypothetical protein
VRFSGRDARYFDATTGAELPDSEAIEDVTITQNTQGKGLLAHISRGYGVPEERRALAFLGTVAQARAAGVRFEDEG